METFQETCLFVFYIGMCLQHILSWIMNFFFTKLQSNKDKMFWEIFWCDISGETYSHIM